MQYRLDAFVDMNQPYSTQLFSPTPPTNTRPRPAAALMRTHHGINIFCTTGYKHKPQHIVEDD